MNQLTGFLDINRYDTGDKVIKPKLSDISEGNITIEQAFDLQIDDLENNIKGKDIKQQRTIRKDISDLKRSKTRVLNTIDGSTTIKSLNNVDGTTSFKNHEDLGRSSGLYKATLPTGLGNYENSEGADAGDVVSNIFITNDENVVILFGIFLSFIGKRYLFSSL